MISSIKQTPSIIQRSQGQNPANGMARINNSAVCEKNGIKREPANVNFCGFFSPEKMNQIYKSKTTHRILKFADDQPLVFGAGFALLLTCVLRPLSIIVLPSKKNKEDQKYASAHSIASGIIGFAISTVLFYPIGSAVKAIKEKPGNFIKNKNSYLNDKKLFGTAKTLLDRTPDILSAIPKGILTIAVIPPILKYVFGIEKKKKTTNENQQIKENVNVKFTNTEKNNFAKEVVVNGGLK